VRDRRFAEAVLGIAAATVLLTYLGLALFVAPAADDYCYAVRARVLGFLPAQAVLYQKWSGRCTATLLQARPCSQSGSCLSAAALGRPRSSVVCPRRTRRLARAARRSVARGPGSDARRRQYCGAAAVAFIAPPEAIVL
jgi:hypothetical protein